MKNYSRKIMPIGLVILTILLVIILVLYINQTKSLDYASVVYLSGVYAYIDTQLLPLSDDLSSDEWDQRVSYLNIIGNMLSPGIDRYGDYGKISRMIMYLGGVSHESYYAAIDLIRPLRLSFNTRSPVSADVISGDIDAIIEELKSMINPVIE